MIKDLKQAIDEETWNITGNDGIKIQVETKTHITKEGNLFIDTMRNLYNADIQKYIENKYGIFTKLHNICGDTIIECYF